MQAIEGIIDAHVNGEKNDYSSGQVRDSKGRFDRMCTQLAEFGQFADPPVVMAEGSHHRILDGHHRIAAWIHRQSPNVIDCWSGHAPP
jgi:hypothetical protein